jgi:hypothetical protein
MGDLVVCFSFSSLIIVVWVVYLAVRWWKARSLLLRQFPRAPGETFIWGHGNMLTSPRSHILMKEVAENIGPVYYGRILGFHVRCDF